MYGSYRWNPPMRCNKSNGLLLYVSIFEGESALFISLCPLLLVSYMSLDNIELQQKRPNAAATSLLTQRECFEVFPHSPGASERAKLRSPAPARETPKQARSRCFTATTRYQHAHTLYSLTI